MKKIVLIFMIVTMALMNGCIERKADNLNKDSRTSQYVIYNIEKLPEDLLQLNSSAVRDRDLLLSLFEGLVKVDETGKVMPAIAESWTVSKDELTYSFKIRENAKWSDGTPITAKDFVQFFGDILNPRVTNIYSNQLYCIFGAKEYNNSKKPLSGVAIRAVDDNTFEIRLNSPTGNFLEVLSQPIYSLRKVNSTLINWKDSYKNIVFTGPFVLDNVSKEGELTLAKNTCYYASDEVKSETLYIVSGLDSENALAGLKTSKLNVFVNPPISEINNLIFDGEAETIPIDTVSGLNFNLKKEGIIKNINFRKALSIVINRSEIIDNNLSSIARTASAFLPFDKEDMPHNTRKKQLIDEDADISKANKLLQENSLKPRDDKDNKDNKGNKDNKAAKETKTSIKVVYLNNNENKRLCEAIAKALREDLGLEVSCKGYSQVEFKDILKNGDYDLVKMDYASQYNDPLSLLEYWVSNSEFNTFGYTNTEFDNLIAKARYEKDAAKRAEYLQKGEEVLINDMPTIPIYFRNIVLCKMPNVEGIYVTKEGNVKLDRAFINKEMEAN